MADCLDSSKDSLRDDVDKSGDNIAVTSTNIEVATGDTYSKTSVTFMIIFSTLALGSDGYNASIISNLSLLYFVIYPELSSSMYTRLSNSFLIGMVVGMLLFGYAVDHLGRKRGAILTTLILVVGIALSAAASGTSQNGMFWMLVVARGIAGVGAGG